MVLWVTMTDNKWQWLTMTDNDWQWVTMSWQWVTMSDNEWQWVTMSWQWVDNESQWVTMSHNESQWAITTHKMHQITLSRLKLIYFTGNTFKWLSIAIAVNNPTDFHPISIIRPLDIPKKSFWTVRLAYSDWAPNCASKIMFGWFLRNSTKYWFIKNVFRMSIGSYPFHRSCDKVPVRILYCSSLFNWFIDKHASIAEISP